MAVSSYINLDGLKIYKGLSTDTKPTNSSVPDNAWFYVLDSNTRWAYSLSAGAWVQVPYSTAVGANVEDGTVQSDSPFWDTASGEYKKKTLAEARVLYNIGNNAIVETIKTASATAALAENYTTVRYNNGASAYAYTIPNDDVEAWPGGAWINVSKVGAGEITITKGTSVAFDPTSALGDANCKIDGTSGSVMLEKVGASITAATIAFVDGGEGADTITDTGSGFLSAGFYAGMPLRVTNSTNNNGITATSPVVIVSVVAGTITLATGSITAETAGATLTIECVNFWKPSGTVKAA